MILVTEINLMACLCGFLSVLVTCFIILTSKKWHLKYSSDSNVGPQKIHKDLVPRIGGFSLLAGIVTAILFEIPFAAGFLIGGLPVFLTGITEDISNKIPPLFRLSASIISALILVWIFSLQLTANGIPLLNSLFSIKFIALIITILSIALMAQSINIIDGLNGLSIGATLIMIASIGIIAFNNGDSELTQFSWFFFTCLLGLFIFNFPRGFLFVGDGGAYLLGCFIAVMAILLAERNYNVSSFASLLIVSYPIYETVRSFIRRTFDKNTNFSIADDRHLHNFVYKFVSKLINLNDTNQNKIWMPNAIAGASCCALPAITGIVAIIFQANMPILVSCLFVTLILYEICLFLLKRV